MIAAAKEKWLACINRNKRYTGQVFGFLCRPASHTFFKIMVKTKTKGTQCGPTLICKNWKHNRPEYNCGELIATGGDMEVKE